MRLKLLNKSFPLIGLLMEDDWLQIEVFKKARNRLALLASMAVNDENFSP